MAIKVGDRVRGYGGKPPKGLPVYEGKIIDMLEPQSAVCKVRIRNMDVKYVWKDSAELLSTPLPLPAPIDWTKPVRTKGGLSVRILCTDGPHHLFSVIGIIEGHTSTSLWTKTGEHNHLGALHPSHDGNLENVPPPKISAKSVIMLTRAGRLYVLPEYCGGGSKHLTIEVAKEAYPTALAFCEVELVEGEGME